MEKTLAKLRRKEPVTIVVQGDSNTVLSMNTRGHLNWVGYLEEALWERYGDGLVTMINVSKCGFGYKRLPESLDQQILRWQPDLVIFQLWLDMGDSSAAAQERARQAFRESVGRLHGAGAEVLVCTPNPRVLCPGHILPDGVEPGTVYEVDAWNAERCAELVALAREEGCAVVDHFSAWQRQRYQFAHPGANPRGLWQRMVDPVHPNAVGHLAFFRELAPAFDVARHFLWEEA